MRKVSCCARRAELNSTNSSNSERIRGRWRNEKATLPGEQRLVSFLRRRQQGDEVAGLLTHDFQRRLPDGNIHQCRTARAGANSFTAAGTVAGLHGIPFSFRKRKPPLKDMDLAELRNTYGHVLPYLLQAACVRQTGRWKHLKAPELFIFVPCS